MTDNSGKVTKTSSICCPRCGGSGWIIETINTAELYGDGTTAEVAMQCPDCNGGIASRSEQVRERASIPSVFYDASLSQFDWRYTVDGKEVNTQKIRTIAESFVNDFEKWEARGMGLYIFSRTRGSGKTYLASCLCNELMKKKAITTKFVRCGDLLDIVKGADTGSQDEYKRNPILLLQRCKLLVLDDLGQKRTAGAWMDDVLFQIVDERVSNGLVTLFTSNVPVDQLDLDERVVSRIHSIAVTLPLPEFSHRGRVATQKKRAFLEELGVMQ